MSTDIARKAAEKMKESGWLHAFTEVGQVSNLVQLAIEEYRRELAIKQTGRLMALKGKSRAASAERGTPITASEDMPPPCALCGRKPHPDSWGHSYRPRDENAIAPAERGEQPQEKK